MSDLTRALKEDLRNVDRIADETGQFLRENPETSMRERFFWAISVAIFHIIQWILRREKI